MDEIDRVIAGLTEAGMSALSMASSGPHGFSGVSLATRVRLHINGLIERARECEQEDDPPLFRLTPLGLAVRARLQETSDA